MGQRLIRQWKLDDISEFFLVTAISTAIVGFVFLLTELRPPEYSGYDHPTYNAIATDITECTGVGCIRIVKPFLASVVPGGLQRGFLVVTLVSLVVTGILIYYLAIAMDFSPGTAMLGIFLYHIPGYMTEIQIRNYWLTESTGAVFFVAIILAIIKERDWLVVPLLLVGVATREAVFYVVAVYYFYNMRQLVDVAALRKTILISLPTIAFYFIVFGLIPAHSIPTALLTDSGMQVYRGPLTNLVANPLSAAVLTVLPYGLLGVFPLFGGAKQRRFLTLFGVAFVLGYFQLLLIDVWGPGVGSRYLTLNLAFVVLLSLQGLSEFTEELSELVGGYPFSPAYYIPFAVAVLALHGRTGPSLPDVALELSLFVGYTAALGVLGLALQAIDPPIGTTPNANAEETEE
jgi:hypothetical protein